MRRLALSLCLVMSGCAMTAADAERQAAEEQRTQAKLDTALVGYSRGPTTNCLDTRSLDLTVYGDTLVYNRGMRTQWVNRTSGGCNGLRQDDILVTRSYSAQMCRGDIIRTVSRTAGMQTGSCVFGSFDQYRKAQ